MKKPYLLLLLGVMLIGCETPGTSVSSNSNNSSISSTSVTSSIDNVTSGNTSVIEPTTSIESSSSDSSSSSQSSTSSNSSITSSASSITSSNKQDNVTIHEDAGDYYDDIDFDQSATNLKTSLSKLIKNHKTLSYDALWECYEITDLRSDGTIWDMYSNYRYDPRNDRAGNYHNEGDVYNREHSIPKSWFNNASPMVSDLMHIVPTDGYVNGRRSNYPFGEVGNAKYTSENGSKLGSSSFPGYSGTVFEPIDEYKGDFARIYMYFVTCYQDKNISNSEGSKVFRKSGSYNTFTTYARDLFLKWNEEDPISQKEIDRNNGVYQCQGNRNPFVDIPELAELIF